MKDRLIRLPALVLALLLAFGPLFIGSSSPLTLKANAASSVIGNYKSSVYPLKNIKAGIKKYAGDNADIKGWLIVPNTNISKPIAFSSKDNYYYAYRDIKGVDHPGTTYLNFTETAIYLDCRVVFGATWNKSSRNTVLYGHNWTNLKEPVDVGYNNTHAMFGQLPSYTNIDFAKTNPHIYFSTSELEGVWRVFSVAYVEEKFKYNDPNPTVDDYTALLQELQKRSVFNFDVDVTSTDRILTLSTCTRQYNAGGNQRFIVVARLLRDGEKETDTVTVTANPNPKQPQFS